MGYPQGTHLEEILRENLSLLEAKVALSLPTKVPPLQITEIDEISQKIDLSQEELAKVLEDLASRGLLFSGTTKKGRKGYALQQMGYGFPQSYFWKREKTPHTQRMAQLIVKYRKETDLDLNVYGTTKTKNYRYVPIEKAIPLDIHAVFPFDKMEEVINKAKAIAVSHCSCRVAAELLKGEPCQYPMEVCIKYDELAQYVIDRGLARKITKAEALEIIKECEEAGLVHMVDNSQKNIKHTCNCCPCCCWSVRNIRKRRIPRDIFMATYFIRDTDKELCSGCGECVESCPVDAITIDSDYPVVDTEWCIGCGLCIRPCPTSAAVLKRKTPSTPPNTFEELHTKIIQERGLDEK
jgi:NAD-dependent dihydropyrimidine dehydrogenase PreA subunit